MRKIEDYSDVKLGDFIGAVCHHTFFMKSDKILGEISRDVDFIRQNGHGPYILREYPNPEARTKNIILNNISEELYVADGNKHCVALVTAFQGITVGHLLEFSPKLFRYWEEGVEEGGDAAYMPYVTYIPHAADVSRIPEAKQGTDDKGDRINIIPSNIPYDSDKFSEADRGRRIHETAHTIEVEAVYAMFMERVGKAATLRHILGYCGQMYDLISSLNVSYGYVQPYSGYDHTLIWFIAGRVQEMPIDNAALSSEVRAMPKETFAGHIFNSIDEWGRG